MQRGFAPAATKRPTMRIFLSTNWFGTSENATSGQKAGCSPRERRAAASRSVVAHCIRYRYYASAPVLNGEAKTASAGSVSRVPAADIEDTIVKSLEKHLAAKRDGSTSCAVQLKYREALAQFVVGIVVHRDKLVVRFMSDHTDEASDRSDDPSLTIAWQKPPTNEVRTHLSLDKDAPTSRPAESWAHSLPSGPGRAASPICSALICE